MYLTSCKHLSINSTNNINDNRTLKPLTLHTTFNALQETNSGLSSLNTKFRFVYKNEKT
jgi:hypothetical protein